MPGPLALIGGNEFLPPARELDAWLLERAGTSTVSVVPTAAALQNPQKAVATARRHFESLGASVKEVMVLHPKDASDEAMAAELRSSAFIYLTGGNPRRTVGVLRDSAVWKAILKARAGGAIIAGSSAGAMILCRVMLVPRWVRPSEGLGVLPSKLVLPHHDAWIRRVDKVTRSSAARDLTVLGIDECTGLVIDENRSHILGAGSVTAYKNGEIVWSEKAPSDRAST